MLDTETKRKINACRDILVGKVPDPKGQVEQITIALIYKFMDDMDKQAEEWGGKPTFFTGDYEKYAWSKIFDPRLGGFDLIALYADAIARMNQNPNIPQLFRDIFKNAYLPYRSPETLKSFLKQINEFHYDHSERLGDAYEYLLSVLSSQGEAGQFRTPRHIIDFIVKIVDPKKKEVVLDPACGTAGFLISSYRHILQSNKNKVNGDKLTNTEKKRLVNNFSGYDISPDMVRMSLVNMYLHNFPDPKIYEYDTLSSEQRWNETADCIFANPPFMTPKGGIRPHKRFSIQAKRSEALFVDYIAEHLNPHGRAGVIVPEGIIFKSQNAYKQLRKMLVDNFLWCVVSLPAGVFNPYAGVKTSILLMDKQLSKKTDYILFVKIENDGFDLGAQRGEIDKNDLPKALEYIKQYQKELLSGHLLEDTDFAHSVGKEKIAETGDYNLSANRYKTFEHQQSDWPMVELRKLCEYIRGVTYSKKDEVESGGTGVLRANNIDLTSSSLDLSGIKHIRSDLNLKDTQKLKKNDILICASSGSKDHIGKVAFSDKDYDHYFGGFMAVLRTKSDILPKYLFRQLLTSNFRKHIEESTVGVNIRNLKASIISSFQIPLPPLSVQEEIVAEIDSYQKIVDGARQVVENYKPTIKIEPDWPIVALRDLTDIKTGKLNANKAAPNGKYPFFTCSKDIFRIDDYAFDCEALLLAGNNAAGIFDVKYYKGKFNAYQRTYVITINQKQLAELEYPFLRYQLNQHLELLRQKSIGSSTKYLTIGMIDSLPIAIPLLSIQKQIVAQIEAEQEMVNANKKLIEIYEQKTKAKIAEVWGYDASRATVEDKTDEKADSRLLIAEVAEHYRTDVSVACLVLQHFKERGKAIREFHLQKYAYIAQQYLKLPIVSEFQPMAAGPWSSTFKNYACAYARQQQWFSLKGRNVEPGEALKAGTAEAEKILGRQRGKVLQLLDDLKRFGDSGLERWATILMVVSQLKAAGKAVTRHNIQIGIDEWPDKRDKEWFTKNSVNKAIDGMTQKGWIKLIGE